jgi:PAS domain-containing protein
MLGRSTISTDAYAAMAHARSGTFFGNGRVDGIKRLIAFKYSDAFPIIALLALSKDDLFAAYYRHRPLYIGANLAVTLMVIVVIVGNALRQSRLARSERMLREKSREQALTFESMTQGLSMFDEREQLVVWNKQYELITVCPRIWPSAECISFPFWSTMRAKVILKMTPPKCCPTSALG